MARSPRKPPAATAKNIVNIDGRDHRPWAVVSKEKLLRAAVSEIAARGLEHVRLTDIAARADLTVGAIYNWFKNKSELFAAAVEYAITEQHQSNANYLSGISVKLPTGYTSDHWIVQIAELTPRQGNDQLPTDAQRMLLEALRTAWRDEDSQAIISPQVSVLLSQYETIIQNAMEQGAIDNSLDPKMVARLFMAMPIGLTTITLSGQPDVDPFKYIEIFQRIDIALKPK
jgi:AcrR family transcriptional regulator